MIRESGGFYNRDPRNYELRVALLYPAPYLASVNSLGHQMLYFILNSVDGVMAERFVTDIRGSIESGRSLKDFDLIIATVHFEGQYPILLRMISKLRKPLIVGGPAVSANPIPISGVAKAVGVGDGEVLIPYLIEALLENDLDSLSSRGFFIPSLRNKVSFTRTREINPLRRQILVTKDQIPINKFLLEISRGCGWGCRFCMIGWHWRPRLDPNLSTLEEALDYATHAGFQEIYIVGSDAASSSILKDALQMIIERGLRASLPSLRADQVDSELIKLAVAAGERTLTLAPETGSDKIKHVINKSIDNEEFLRVAQEGKENGMKHVKLYFITGLPWEEDEDLIESVKLANKVRSLIDTKVTVSIFVPKAGTPFENMPLEREHVVKRRISLFRKGFRGRINAMHYGRAYIQTIFSVGGFEIARFLREGYEVPYNKGAYRSFARSLGIDLDRIVYHRRDTPWWDFVDTGIRREYLSKELDRASRYETTPGCDIACTRCMENCWILSKKV